MISTLITLLLSTENGTYQEGEGGNLDDETLENIDNVNSHNAVS